jgi:hypothetical protein
MKKGLTIRPIDPKESIFTINVKRVSIPVSENSRAQEQGPFNLLKRQVPLV